MMTVAESRTVRVTVTPEYHDYASDTQAIMIQLENLKLNLLFFCCFSFYDTSDSDYSILNHFPAGPIIFDYFWV